LAARAGRFFAPPFFAPPFFAPRFFDAVTFRVFFALAFFALAFFALAFFAGCFAAAALARLRSWSANDAPCESVHMTTRSPPGTSMGPMSTLPPPRFTAFTDASMSGTLT